MMSFIAGFVARLRYLMLFPVLVLLLLSLLAIGAGLAALAGNFWAPEGRVLLPESPGAMADVVPFFLQAAFLYFLAASLCSLFIADLPVPQWMAVRNLYQFRNKVLTFLSVILALFFLGYAAQADNPVGILVVGGGVALVMAGILLLVRFGHPLGDEAAAREGNRPPPPQAGKEMKREPEQGRKQAPSREPEKDWLEKQKSELRFERESMKPVLGGERKGEVPAGGVTVGAAPRRGHEHRRRRRRHGRPQDQGGGPSGASGPSEGSPPGGGTGG